MQAKAIVFRKANEPTLEAIDIPDPGPDEVLVKTHYSGVSIGTDSSIFSGLRTENGTFPLVGGYMTSGVVEQVGANVRGLAAGDRVAGPGTRLDGEINSVFGGHASAIVARGGQFVKVPEGVSMREASYHVMPRVGLNAIGMTRITEQDRVLVFGQGLIGQFFAQFARGRGATVITVEPEPSRAALSREYVTEHVLNPFEDDVAARVDAITDGKGASVVVEATASPRNIEQASSHLRGKATFVFLSWYSGDIKLKFHRHFHAHAVTAVFPMGAGDTETLRAVMDGLHRGSIVMGRNLTDDLSFEEACDGYRRIIDGDRAILGMTFDWRNA